MNGCLSPAAGQAGGPSRQQSSADRVPSVVPAVDGLIAMSEVLLSVPGAAPSLLVDAISLLVSVTADREEVDFRHCLPSQRKPPSSLWEQFGSHGPASESLSQSLARRGRELFRLRDHDPEVIHWAVGTGRPAGSSLVSVQTGLFTGCVTCHTCAT